MAQTVDQTGTAGGWEESARAVDRDFQRKVAEAGAKLWFLPYLIALYRFMRDERVSWLKKGIAVSALAYFILPVDSVPDIAPIVGYLDDLGVVTAAVRYLGHQLQPYLPFS